MPPAGQLLVSLYLLAVSWLVRLVASQELDPGGSITFEDDVYSLQPDGACYPIESASQCAAAALSLGLLNDRSLVDGYGGVGTTIYEHEACAVALNGSEVPLLTGSDTPLAGCAIHRQHRRTFSRYSSARQETTCTLFFSPRPQQVTTCSGGLHQTSDDSNYYFRTWDTLDCLCQRQAPTTKCYMTAEQAQSERCKCEYKWDGRSTNPTGVELYCTPPPTPPSTTPFSPVWDLPSPSGNLHQCARVTSVFGVRICVTNAAWASAPSKCDHVANVLAELLDNDEDGAPDDPTVLAEMISGGYGLFVTATENEVANPPSSGRWRLFGLFEAVPNACDVPVNRGASATDRASWAGAFVINTTQLGCDTARDATVEEVLHLITEAAAVVFPSLWRTNYTSQAGAALSEANGNCGNGHTGNYISPSVYPAYYCSGQYAHDDPTCDVACLVVEGIYWASISYVGGFYWTTRAHQIRTKWLMATPDDGMPLLPWSVANRRVANARTLQSGSPALYALVSDTTSAGHAWLPHTMPDGRYLAPP